MLVSLFNPTIPNPPPHLSHLAPSHNTSSETPEPTRPFPTSDARDEPYTCCLMPHLPATAVQFRNLPERQRACPLASSGWGDPDAMAADDVLVDLVAQLGWEAEQGGVQLVKQGAVAVQFDSGADSLLLTWESERRLWT